MLVPTDKLHIEFYTITTKKNRKKLFAVFDLILESLIDTKYIDIPEENLSDSNNYLISSTIQIKLYYTPPNIEIAVPGENDEDTSMIDFRARFDEEGRHGGHRTRHVRSKNDSKLFVLILSSKHPLIFLCHFSTKIRRALIRRKEDADTDSYSDTEFGHDPDTDEILGPMGQQRHAKIKFNNLELLEKRSGETFSLVDLIFRWF